MFSRVCSCNTPKKMFRKLILPLFVLIIFIAPASTKALISLSNPSPTKLMYKASSYGSNSTALSWSSDIISSRSFKFYLDTDQSGYNGTYLTQKSYWVTYSTINLGSITSGKYYLYIGRLIASGQYEYSNYVPVHINSVPEVSVIEPSSNVRDDRFNIKYLTADLDDSKVSVKVQVDKDKTPGNGNERTIMSVSSTVGEKQFIWEPDLDFNGNYYIYTIVNDGLNTDYSYSAGLAMAYKDPKAAVNILAPSINLNFNEPLEYATQTFSDPWDMDNADDIAHRVIRFSNVSMKGGVWQGVTNSADSYFWFLWGGYPGAYLMLRDGERVPIDTNTYSRLSFKMYVNANEGNDKGAFYWFYRSDLKEPQVVFYRPKPGWNIYTLDLNWAGKRPVSLRLDPIERPNTLVKIDWIRLTNRVGASTNLQWTDSAKNEPTLYVDNDRGGLDGAALTGISSTNRNNAQRIDLDGLDPGSYYFYAQKWTGGYSNYSAGGIHINRAPIVKVLEPNEQGGRDWATTYLKNPWDMNSSRDVGLRYNIKGVNFGKGVFSAVNGRSSRGSRINDPYFLLNQKGKVINSSRFHRLTVRYKYSGKFSLVRGTMSRVGWTTIRQNDPRWWQMSDDILTYDGWNTLVVDLKKIKLNRGNYGWRNLITRLRFDPHEDEYGARRFFVDSVSLREDDRLVKRFPIKFSVRDDSGSVRVSIYADRDLVFGNGNERLITNMNTAPGMRTFSWAPSRRVKGLYWIYIKADDGANTRGYYSTGPLRVH